MLKRVVFVTTVTDVHVAPARNEHVGVLMREPRALQSGDHTAVPGRTPWRERLELYLNVRFVSETGNENAQNAESLPAKIVRKIRVASSVN